VALVDGQRISVPPDARMFLLLLLEAEGEEMHKSELAERMGKAHNFKVSSVFRHCKALFDTFVVGDERGRYRLAESYCLNSEFEKGGGP
jgi:predicted transcriptional regulator